jgi:transcriptional regulator with XRE-family HTH domain
MEDFGKKIRILREAIGLSLRDVEDLDGTKAVVLGSYERGDRHPSLKRADEVLKFYGKKLAIVDSDEGFGGTGRGVYVAEEMVEILEAMAHQIKVTNGI